MTADVVPYLNVTARWDGAPDQGLHEQKGGTGMPFGVLMQADGEVVAEVVPWSRGHWTGGLELARRLLALRRAALERPDDPALRASVVLLDQMGRLQRRKLPLAEVDVHAATAGVDPDLKARYREWRAREELDRAADRMAADGGAAAFDLYRAGRRPPASERGLVYSFYRAALEGAIRAGDAGRARELLDVWVASCDPKWGSWIESQAAQLRKRIDAIDS